MKASDIYKFNPIEIDYDISRFIKAVKDLYSEEGRSLPIHEVIRDVPREIEKSFEEEKRIETRVYISDGDDKYPIGLFSIFFDSKPLMVVQNSGRWGDEYTTFLTDTTLFAEVEEYIKSKLPPVNTLPDSCDPDADLTQLNEINGYPISDYYEHDLNPKYKVGDIVWAWTKENNSVSNYDESNKGYVLTRIKIDKLSPNHPYETYGGSQIDRYYEPLKRDVIFKENSDRPYYAYLNDRLIIGKVEEMPIPSLAINYFVNEEGKLPESYKFEEPIFPKPRPKM